MMNKILIKSNNIEYECYKKAERNVIQNSDEINVKLERIREIVDKIHFSRGNLAVKYEICFYLSKDINAFAAKIADKEYVIAISNKLLVGLGEELEKYFINFDLKKYFWGNKRNARRHAQKVQEYIFNYVALHEYYHILNGHCDSPYAIGNLMMERSIYEETENNRFRQILECDADYCAVNSCSNIISETYKDLEDRNREIRFLGFSIYYIFLKFQESGYENMHYITNLYVNPHPPASIRFVYTYIVIVHEILKYIDKGNMIKEICMMMEVGIYFDRVYYDAETFDLSLVALAYTERGTKHLQELHDGWNELRGDLQNVAYISLKYNETVDFEKHVWVDNGGNIMYSKLYERFGNIEVNKKS